MKFTKLLAVVLSVVLAATAMLTSAFALTGTIEEGDVTGVQFDLTELYPQLADAQAWADGVEIDFTYEIDGLVEVVDGYGIGCGGNAALFIKYGEEYKWKDKNNWSQDVNWIAEKDPAYNTAKLQFDTEGADIKEAGFRLYNFQQAEDGDLDNVIIGKTINVEILDVRVGGESIVPEEPADSEEVPADSEEVPADSEEVPADSEEVPADSEEVPADSEEDVTPDGAYILATVEGNTVTLETKNFPEGIYGLQYTVAYTGTPELAKAELPEGWSATYPKTLENGFTAVYDCDFTADLGDQAIVTLTFADNVTDFAFEAAKGVDENFAGVEVASKVVFEAPVDSEEEPSDSDTEVPSDSEKVPADSEEVPADSEEVPADSEKAADSDTVADTATDAATDSATDSAKPVDNGTNPAPKAVDTGVVGFASILGVVTLAGVVASKKR